MIDFLLTVMMTASAEAIPARNPEENHANSPDLPFLTSLPDNTYSVR